MRKRLLFNGFLGLLVLAIAFGVFATVRSSSGSAATTQTFATAKRGVVLQSVTSTGNVEAPKDLSLSFQQSGQVKAIYVVVGDHVNADQALAQVDDTEQKMALASAQAGVASAQASYAALIRGETAIERQSDAMSALSAAQGVTTAQQAVTDAQQTAASNATKNQQSVDQAQQSLMAANTGVSSSQTDLDQAEVALSALQKTADPDVPSGKSSAALNTRYQLATVDCAAHTADTSYRLANGIACAQVNNLSTFVKTVQSSEASVTQAQTQQQSAQAALSTAQQAKASGELQDKQQVQTAQSQLTSAQTQYQTALVSNAVKQEAPKPEALAQAQEAIVSAQAQLSTAQKNEADTTLRAPAAGVIASINGLVGQQSGSGGASSSSGSSSASSSASSSSSTSSSSSSGFIDLTDVNLLDVKVGFTETDAPKVKIGQAATITLDALPNQTFSGHVVSLDTDSTLVSNVVTYYAKVGFDTTPADVKPGMTASVNVVLDKRDNAITLPTSAVSTTGTSQTVTVKADGSASSKTITIGLRGDSAVEITNGLSVGDQVVITSSASTAGTGNGFPGGFPGGGGGLGGGLGGGGAGR